MTKSDLIHNLGTIAKSGTHRHLWKPVKNNANLSMIGQFWSGFLFSIFSSR